MNAVQGNDIGSALRQRPAAYILGQGVCKTLFIHAGLPLQLTLQVIQQSSSSKPDRIVDELNVLVKGARACNDHTKSMIVHDQCC